MDNVKLYIDSTLGTAGITAPVWVEYLSTGLGVFTLLVGAGLMVLRFLIALREWRAGKKDG
jgi:hypothetical protein